MGLSTKQQGLANTAVPRKAIFQEDWPSFQAMADAAVAGSHRRGGSIAG